MLFQRSAQIADLQQKLLDADNGDRVKQCCDNIGTVPEARRAVKYLLGELVSSKVHASKLESSNQLSDACISDMNKLLLEERSHGIEVEAELEKQILLQEQQKQEILCLLSQVQEKEASEKRLEDELKFKDEELEKMREKNQELTQKIDILEQQKTRRQAVAKPREPTPEMEVKEGFSESGESGEEEDEEWAPVKAVRKAKKSVTGCFCKGQCGNRQCGCRKQKVSCTAGCNCDSTNCRNREPGPQGAAMCEDQTKDSEGSFKLEDLPDVTAGETFFKPVYVPPNMTVLNDITDQDVSMKLSTSTGKQERDEESQKNQFPFKRKKRMLNSNTSFFAGCTPIKEEFK